MQLPQHRENMYYNIVFKKQWLKVYKKVVIKKANTFLKVFSSLCVMFCISLLNGSRIPCIIGNI